MGIKGRLTRENVAYSMPPRSPLYMKPPIQSRNVQTLSVAFETDLDAALEVLPEPLELEEPVIATLGVFHIGMSGIGSFSEANLVLRAFWNGEPRRYNVTMMVGNDQAFSFGREVLGSSKKLGHVVLERNPEGVFGYVERPRGHRLVTLGCALERVIEPDPDSLTIEPSVSFRVIGQPEGAEQNEVTAELLETAATWEIVEQWSGKGSIAFPTASDIDDWQMLPVKKITGSYFTTFNIEMVRPTLLARM